MHLPTKRKWNFCCTLFQLLFITINRKFVISRQRKKRKNASEPIPNFFLCFQAVLIMSKSLSDLVLGELQQMNGGKKEDPFESYLKKTYNKTASLMANSCQAVAHIAVQNCNYNFLSQGWFT